MRDGAIKRQPKQGLTRAGFRISLFLWFISFPGLALIAIGRLSRLGLDFVGYGLLAVLMALLIMLAYLLRVRHRESHAWNEEEARQKERDRRGRA